MEEKDSCGTYHEQFIELGTIFTTASTVCCSRALRVKPLNAIHVISKAFSRFHKNQNSVKKSHIRGKPVKSRGGVLLCVSNTNSRLPKLEASCVFAPEHYCFTCRLDREATGL